MNTAEVIPFQQTRKDAVANAIERIAMRLFAKHGYNEVTVEEIAVASGISQRTFFRYFPNKSDLLRAHQRRLGDRLVRALNARPIDEHPIESLQQAFLQTSEMRPGDEETIALIGKIYDRGPGLETRELRYESERVNEVIEILAMRWKIEPDMDLRPTVAATAIYATANATYYKWLDNSDKTSLITMLKEAFTLLNEGFDVLKTSTRPKGESELVQR